MPIDPHELNELRRELNTRRPVFRCKDRMCGGTDCATCYPDIEFQQNDEEQEEEGEDESD